jgi:hypothetical protein
MGLVVGRHPRQRDPVSGIFRIKIQNNKDVCFEEISWFPDKGPNFAGMSRIMAIDYGRKRCGLAVTDPLQIAAHPLETVLTEDLLAFLKKYLEKEDVKCIVLGKPFHKDGNPMEIAKDIDRMAEKLKKEFPGV